MQGRLCSGRLIRKNKPNTVDSVAAALVALEKGPSALPPAPWKVWVAKVKEWVRHYDVSPGSSLAIPAGDLYRHFARWAKKDAVPPMMLKVAWGRCLKNMGFVRVRTRVGGIHRHPVLMRRRPAKYFRAWFKRNPPPADYGPMAYRLGKLSEEAAWAIDEEIVAND